MKKFFNYSQDNSGGDFIVDDKVTIDVWIEAHNSDEANTVAEKLGIYFDGVATGTDCDCCGDRWHTPFGDGEYSPKVDIWAHRWVEKGEPHTRIYYADGRVDEIITKASDL